MNQATTSPLVQVALSGTTRQSLHPIVTDTPLDTVLAGLPAAEAERALLLAAGAWSVYQQAGRLPTPLASAPDPALPETLPVCSPAAAQLISGMLEGVHGGLLPDALRRLSRAGQRLPAALLPSALSQGAKVHLRPLLHLVIGQRGRWLSQFDPQWHWASADLPHNDEVPDGAKMIWQEGDLAQRIEVLRRVRTHDPAVARQWLADVWKSEKADVRAQLIDVLRENLTLADEPFLEAALDDRSVPVRGKAASLLAQLPDSAFAARIAERAAPLLSYVPPATSDGLVGRVVQTGRGATPGVLTVHPPTAFDKSWQRDGVELKPPAGIGERLWWLTQTQVLVPPAYWVAHFQVQAADLVAAVQQDEWHIGLMQGWTQAALLFRDADWATLLWQWWQNWDASVDHLSDVVVREMCANLLAIVPQQEAERLLVELLKQQEPRMDARVTNSLNALPAPWGVVLSQAYLAGLNASLTSSIGNTTLDQWLHTFSSAGLGLAEECHAEVSQLRESLTTMNISIHNWYVEQWHRAIRELDVIISIRRQLSKEIGPP